MNDDQGAAENTLSAHHLSELRALIKSRLGINISQDKNYLIESKIGKLLKFGGDKLIEEFMEELRQGDKTTDIALARFITTGHTYFFREREHLDYLCKDISLKEIKEPRIWCAACSTGEEPYSIAIALAEWGIRDPIILASDVNADALKTCRRGIYKTDRLREFDPMLRDRYFRRAGTDWQIKEFLVGRLILKRINLMESIRFEKTFHYIFCRNVFIYFDNETQRRVTKSLLDNLEPDGKIFVGLSEPLIHLSDSLASVAPSVYMRKK